MFDGRLVNDPGVHRGFRELRAKDLVHLREGLSEATTCIYKEFTWIVVMISNKILLAFE